MSSLAKTRQRCYNISMTDTTDDVYEPAVLVKPGTPLVKPHDHRNHLPKGGWLVDAPDDDSDGEWVRNPALVNGDVYRCTCDDHFMYFEWNVRFIPSIDAVPGDGHWARCTEDGRVYRRINVAPWWKRMFGVSDYQWVAREQ